MRKQIKNYLEQIYFEIKECYSDEINLKENDFIDYSIFDFVNFHLIYQYILDDNIEKNDFFVSIPEDEYREKFFNSIFHSIVLIKLYQNFFNYEKFHLPPLEKEDLIYKKHNKEHRIFVVKNIYDGQAKINFRFPKKNEIGISDFPINRNNFTKLNPNLVDNKNAAKNVDSYREFLTCNFSDKFPFITDFKKRTLVIAEKQFFKESKFLPIRYTNKNGRISNDLPFFSYLVECCNDFNSAQKYLLNDNQQFDEIIIIGDAKYRNIFDFILQEKYRGKYKNIILIGTEKPNTLNLFTEWWWGIDEIILANDELPNIPIKKIIENEKLSNLYVELYNKVERLQTEKNINLRFLLKYSNFYLKAIFNESNISKGIFQDYLDKFQSDSFRTELKNEFYQNNIYNPIEIDEIFNPIFKYIEDIARYLINSNIKWDYVKQKSKEIFPQAFYLLIEKKYYDAISIQLKRDKIKNVKLISDKKIDNKLFLSDWLKSPQNSLNKILIIPYLNNFELYKTLKLFKGHSEVLCYKDLDEHSVDYVIEHYKKNEKSKLNNQNRQIFFKTKFEFNVESPKSKLEDIFKFDLTNENFIINPNDSIEIINDDSLEYELLFNDYSLEKFVSSKRVFLLEDIKQIKTTIGEVCIGSTIRFYQNNNPILFNKVLRILDTNNEMKIIDDYSKSWIDTIRKIIENEGSAEIAYYKIFGETKKCIQFNTFAQYVNNSRRFPQKFETLSLINEYCKKNNLNEELILKELTNFLQYSKKDNSIRNKVGRVLSNDLMTYIYSNFQIKSPILQKFEEEDLIQLVESIQEKTIIKKTLIDE